MPSRKLLHRTGAESELRAPPAAAIAAPPAGNCRLRLQLRAHLPRASRLSRRRSEGTPRVR
eukprot:4123643-Pyramimonas_sp.AAC.1